MDDSLVHQENMRAYLGYDIEEDDDDQSSGYQDLNYAVGLRLSQVCSHWYHIAVAQPQIWSYLDPRLGLEATELYLARSKGTPLFITCPKGVPVFREFEFLNLVMAHSNRWKAFNSYSEYDGLLTDLPWEDISFPSLESFVNHTDASVVMEIPSQLYEQTPNLREFHAERLGFPFQMGSEALSNLTSLGIRGCFEDRGFTMQDYELLFSSCPRLQTLFISHLRSDPPPEVSMISVKIPNLESLCLYGPHTRLVTTLLFSLFPNPAKPPVVKVLGSCDPFVSKQAFADTSRVGSIMDLACRNMTRLSTKYFNRRDRKSGDKSGLIQIWGESDGKRSPMLEFVRNMDRFGEITASLFSPSWTSVLREVSLTTVDDIAGGLAPNLNCCPRLEHLIIILGHQRKSLERAIDIITRLAFPDGDDEPSTSGPQLKHLSLKEARDSIAELLNARHESTQNLLMDSNLLHRLEKLRVHASKYYAYEDNNTTLRGIEKSLAARGITFEFVE
ncbi:hypothetical protein FRC03_011119 [Tulasnella sp. 419]|nr:hypothetical protein FRC03_011119 [Tulasnella sp. 419]